MAISTTISDIAAQDGQEVVLSGWLYNKRSSGKLHFLQLRDGTGTIQCVVFKGDVSEEVFEASGLLTQESSIVVTGTDPATLEYGELVNETRSLSGEASVTIRDVPEGNDHMLELFSDMAATYLLAIELER